MTRKQWAKLTPEEKRVKVAELCGWTWKWRVVDYIRSEPFRDWTSPEGKYLGLVGPPIPDYLNDLNAMHEAVKELRYHQLVDYCNKLIELTGSEVGAIESTAAQRAEAFVLTMEPDATFHGSPSLRCTQTSAMRKAY